MAYSRIRRYTLIGILFTGILGSLFHFAYEWTGKNYFAGLFFPVSESTWEHMKLIFFPMLLYLPYFRFKLQKEYPCATLALLFSTIAGTVVIPVLFYTYTGILGWNIPAVDIGIFWVSVIFAFLLAAKLTSACQSKIAQRLQNYAPLLVFTVAVFFAAIVLFSYHPLDFGIFRNPEAPS